MSLRTGWLKWGALRLIVALAIAGGLAASAAAAPGDEIYFLTLPALHRAPPGIQGRVTQNGAPVSNVTLELRHYNGSTWSTAATGLTNADGRYNFNAVANLGPGQRYYVRYRNTTADTSRLWYWATRDLLAYTTGDSALIGDFDLANFSHTAPGSGAYVPLPQGFSWAFRPATPADSFDFNLFDADDGDPFFWTNPPLGHVNGYTLHSLPGGFSTNTWYGWFPGVYSPDGGYGEPYYFYWVAFSSAGQAAGAGEWQVTRAAFADSDIGEAVLAWREAER